MTKADLGPQLKPTHVVGSLGVHLVAVVGEGPALRPQTLCGRAVTYLPPVATLLEAGCPECAFLAIATGVRLVRDTDESDVRLSEVYFHHSPAVPVRQSGAPGAQHGRGRRTG